MAEPTTDTLDAPRLAGAPPAAGTPWYAEVTRY
jgi:hypothetical protein